MSYDLDVIAQKNDWILLELDPNEIQESGIFEKLNEYESGTCVLWKRFDKIQKNSNDYKKGLEELRKTISKAISHVALVFHRFYDEVEIYEQNQRIKKIDPFLQSTEKSQKIYSMPIGNCDAKILVQSFIMPFINNLTPEETDLLGETKDYNSNQGFYVYRNKRLIKWGSWFNMKSHSVNNNYARILIDYPAELDDLWNIDVQKSSLRIPRVIQDDLRPLIEDSKRRSESTKKHHSVKERDDKTTIWERHTLPDKKYEFKINREDPIIQRLNHQIDDKAKNLLERFIKKIEMYLPKYDIKSISDDGKKILNSPENQSEDDLLKQISDAVFVCDKKEREIKLQNLLQLNHYEKIKDKKEEIKRLVNELDKS